MIVKELDDLMGWSTWEGKLPPTTPMALKPNHPRTTGAKTGVKATPATAPTLAKTIRRELAECDEFIEHRVV